VRTKCPLCDSPRRLDDWTMDFIVPDGWPNPTQNTICLCLDCGMIYYDNDMTQAGYDEYYRLYYGYDGNEHSEMNLTRLDELAELAAQHAEKDDLIVDFGGGDGYLADKLRGMGYNASTVEVGDPLPKGIDLLISAQTLEHLYDLRPVMEKLVDALSYKGRFLIEIPSCYEMPFLEPPMPILDYHQKHVNHFLPFVLDRLFERWGFNRIYTHSGSTPCYFGWHYRVVYKRWVPENIYRMSKMVIHDRTEAKRLKLEVLGDRPVIVWGCGDLCLHMLARVKLNVVYYVDNDPAFRGATIGGVPVLDAVRTAEPIVVIAQNQATGILKRIQADGLENEVIVI